MDAVSKASIRLSLEDESVPAELKNTEDAVNKFAANVNTAIKTVSFLYIANQAANVASAVMSAGSSALNAFMDSEAAEDKLSKILKATGEEAGRTKDQLTAMATELQSLTNVEDEAIIGAQTLLLTFKNIKGDTFDRTTKAALDMSEVLGGLDSAAMQLGKALNDPEQGLSALSRAGVSFSEEQKKVIKFLAETNRLAEAQAIILDEIDAEFGGAANATGTMADQMEAANIKLGDMQERFGELIAGGIQAFLPYADDTMIAIENMLVPAMGLGLAFANIAAEMLNSADSADQVGRSMEQLQADTDSWATGFETAFSNFTTSLQLGMATWNEWIDEKTGINTGNRESEIRRLTEELNKDAEATEQARIDRRAAAEQQAKQDAEQRKADMEAAKADRDKKRILEQGILNEAQIAEMGLAKAKEESEKASREKAKKEREAEAAVRRAAADKEKAEKQKAKDDAKAIAEAQKAEEKRIREENERAEEQAAQAKEKRERALADLEKSMGRESLTALHDRIQDAMFARGELAKKEIELNAETMASLDPNAVDNLIAGNNGTMDKKTKRVKPGSKNATFALEDSLGFGNLGMDLAFKSVDQAMKDAEAQRQREESTLFASYAPVNSRPSSLGNNVNVEVKQSDVVTAINKQTEVIRTTAAPRSFAR